MEAAHSIKIPVQQLYHSPNFIEHGNVQQFLDSVQRRVTAQVVDPSQGL